MGSIGIAIAPAAKVAPRRTKGSQYPLQWIAVGHSRDHDDECNQQRSNHADEDEQISNDFSDRR